MFGDGYFLVDIYKISQHSTISMRAVVANALK
jgi:hypothetical protein